MVFFDRAPTGTAAGALAGLICVTLYEFIRARVRHARLMVPMRKEYDELLRRKEDLEQLMREREDAKNN